MSTTRDPNTAEVSVVIPQYQGDVVLRAVASLYLTTDSRCAEIIVIDDQRRDDGSLAEVLRRWPSVRIVCARGGSGFGAATNVGIRAATAELVFVLNNDAVVTEGWLPPLLDAAAAHPEAAIFQPKIRSLADPSRFDYGGAAGGMIDVFGYPFALGRVMDVVETDDGQYDTSREIFWAVGAAMLIRRTAANEAGLFDEAFYMHMEEIDLAWRLQLRGWTIRSVPASVVLHEGGHSLKTDSFDKTRLNHRNNLVLLFKNLSVVSLLWVLPARIGLELATVFHGLVRGDWKHPLAAVLALLWIPCHLPSLARRRRAAQRQRRVTDRDMRRGMYRGSIVYQRFVRRRTAARTIPGLRVNRG